MDSTDRQISLLDLVLGVGAAAVDQARSAAGLVVHMTTPVARTAAAPLPPVPSRVTALVQQLAGRGQVTRTNLLSRADEAADVVVPAVLNAVLDRVDLTALIVERVDLGEVIERAELPLIIRQSTQGLTSEAVRGVRMQGFEADQAVTRVVDRLLLRNRGHAPAIPEQRSPNGKPVEAP